jgi:protein phosphatase
MSSNPSEPTPQRPGILPDVLARLGMKPSASAEEKDDEEMLPGFDLEEEAPLALPVAIPAEPAEPVEGKPPEEPPPEAIPVAAEPVAAEPVEPEIPVAAVPVEEPQVRAPQVCPLCQSPRVADQAYCGDCGFFFPPDDIPTASTAGVPAGPAMRLQNRYELGALICEREGVARFRGRDLESGDGPGTPVVILREKLAEAPPAAIPVEPETPAAAVEDDFFPTFDEPTFSSQPSTDAMPTLPRWPSLAWEKNLLELCATPGLPRVLDEFSEDGFAYLVEEVPVGRSLWDVWDDPDATNTQRFGALASLAEVLLALHRTGGILEGLRPEIVVVTDEGQARLTDLSDLLSLPLPPNPPLRGYRSTAPEMLSDPTRVDARADLYSFGALIYALEHHRELSDQDFDRPGHPKPFIPRFPDVHPMIGRLMTKTFVREQNARFPTDEASKEDPSGFTELVRVLQACGRSLDSVRLEIGAWTTTGIVRTGNEDAFALLHGCESRQEDFAESTLIFLADGMGGYEAGEVAAALAIQILRKTLTQHKLFAHLTGASGFALETPRTDGNPAVPFDVEEAKQVIRAALLETNKQIYNASRAGVGRRGMGCTAEVVYVNGQHVVVGHVGDSRVYHIHEGRLIQLSRDHTLVNRLVELGSLTLEEAETHPRRNELQQAIGGQPTVNPDVYHGIMKPGDWVIVCSDGVTNHVKPHELKEMLLREAASAEIAARRLVNLTNIEGATDNATVVVVRAMKISILE